jgi:hypothetical protein
MNIIIQYNIGNNVFKLIHPELEITFTRNLSIADIQLCNIFIYYIYIFKIHKYLID